MGVGRELGGVRVNQNARQLPHPETEERREEGDRRTDPDRDRLVADNALGLTDKPKQMGESKEGEKKRCHTQSSFCEFSVPYQRNLRAKARIVCRGRFDPEAKPDPLNDKLRKATRKAQSGNEG